MKDYWQPYLGGVALGFLLFFSFLICGKSVGGSSFLTRLAAYFVHIVAPSHIENSAYFGRYFAGAKTPLNYWLAYLGYGTFLGGLASAFVHGRLKISIDKGPKVSPKGRLALAMFGGIFVGFASRLGLGCTSGQGLIGASMLSVGSWVFLFSVFLGGYAIAYRVREGWL
ncbi:MAG TPA: hypothetical protein ENG51_23180 [Deltaproteobacteria bacterium]|nr:MAG: hypothetical protein DRG59_00070 [Deltaproteobacteria bacterium]HDM79338.1 hypothetical protein [Deltaproteobacteria bacterium]